MTARFLSVAGEAALVDRQPIAASHFAAASPLLESKYGPSYPLCFELRGKSVLASVLTGEVGPHPLTVGCVFVVVLACHDKLPCIQ